MHTLDSQTEDLKDVTFFARMGPFLVSLQREDFKEWFFALVTDSYGLKTIPAATIHVASSNMVYALVPRGEILNAVSALKLRCQSFILEK
jgi:hypothetical protein